MARFGFWRSSILALAVCIAFITLLRGHQHGSLRGIEKPFFQKLYGHKGDRKGLEEETTTTKSTTTSGSSSTTTTSKSSGSGSTGGGGVQQLSCHREENAEFWGTVVKSGDNHITPTAEECCEACRTYKPSTSDGDSCNIWVWCGEKDGCPGGQPFGACWLKFAPHPTAPDVRRGKDVQWTSGALYPDSDSVEKGPHRKFHIAVTATDTVYQQWQMRIMYYWMKKVRDSDPNTQMGGFTRILHSGRPDGFMSEIPTYVVKRLDDEHGFVVLSRPYAFVQWLEQVDIPEKYVLMSEPDHLFLRPLPNLMIGERPAAFPFFYIRPTEFPALVRKYVGNISDKELAAMDPVGNSPVIMSKSDLQKLAPTWMNMTIAMKIDPEADKAWGWVLEMWAYTCSAQVHGLHHDLHPELAAQPPWDKEIGKFYILHYTYGCDYDLDGTFTPGKIGQWRFDKRAYSGMWLPKNYTLPPKGVPELTVKLISLINEATFVLPKWGEPTLSGTEDA